MTTEQASVDPGERSVAAVIVTAVENAILAQQPKEIGDHSIAFAHPTDWTVTVLDERVGEDRPRYRTGTFPFISVRSLARYVRRYQNEDTLGYITDPGGNGPNLLQTDTTIATYVIDDHPAGDHAVAIHATANREHRAALKLRPTSDARRWGAALSKPLSQDMMLDLVVDGIGQIVEPDGGILRDLVSDLHAIRTQSVQSIVRTGGQATVNVGENVTLHAGPGNAVTIPETMQITFTPFQGMPEVVVLDIRIKPAVTQDSRVVFTLTAPELDNQLHRVISAIAEHLTVETDIEPFWTP